MIQLLFYLILVNLSLLKFCFALLLEGDDDEGDEDVDEEEGEDDEEDYVEDGLTSGIHSLHCDTV